MYVLLCSPMGLDMLCINRLPHSAGVIVTIFGSIGGLRGEMSHQDIDAVWFQILEARCAPQQYLPAQQSCRRDMEPCNMGSD